MNHPRPIAPYQMEEFICILRVMQTKFHFNIFHLLANYQFAFILHGFIQGSLFLGQFNMFYINFSLWQHYYGFTIYHLCLGAPQSNISHQVLYSTIIDTVQSLYNTTWERSGSVVECLNRDLRAAGLSLTSITILCH